MNCSSDLKIFANSWPSALNFKCFSQSLEQFFITVGQNNYGNKIPMYNNETRNQITFQRRMDLSGGVIDKKIGKLLCVS